MDNDQRMKPKTVIIVSNRGNVHVVGGLDSSLCDPYCDCKSFTYKGTCSHIQQAIDKLKEENEQE